MRIKVLLNLGAGTPRFLQDEVHEVTDEVGLELIARHWAIELPPTPVAILAGEESPRVPELEEPERQDAFETMRQHPDHLTKKSSPQNKRGPKRREIDPN
jgi:hypothetical protein